MPIVLVTDPADTQRSFSIESNNTEGYSPTAIKEIIDALRQFSSCVTHFDSPTSFLDAAADYKDAVVIPAFFGIASRNTKSIVPAVCEAYGIHYIGADAYTQALCNDKYLSRLYSKDLGLPVADALLVKSEQDVDFQRLSRLHYPVVVKPNNGGGSNGIGLNSRCEDVKQAMDLIRDLLPRQQVPILVESYLPGFEVQVVFAHMPDGSNLVDQVGISIAGNDYHTEDLFDLSAKKIGDRTCEFSCVKRVSPQSMDVLKAIFDSFAKVDFMRIDCRVDKEGTAYLIELSPDCSLSRSSGMYYAFKHAGYTYSEMFMSLISGSLMSS